MPLDTSQMFYPQISGMSKSTIAELLENAVEDLLEDNITVPPAAITDEFAQHFVNETARVLDSYEDAPDGTRACQGLYVTLIPLLDLD